MAKVRFEPSGYETDITPGTRFIDVTDEHPEAEVPYSCRSASCGTCRVEVKEGHAHLLSPEDDELEVLEVFGDDPKQIRLCCQIRLKDEGRVILRVVEP